MSTERKVAVLVGSLRKASLNRKLAQAVVDAAPSNLKFEMVEIGDLPLYNEDLEAEVPAAWARFRQAMPGYDAVMFVTPEYNRSVPAALKNALDVGSRPYGKSVWDGKPAVVISGSGGGIGGFGANHHLRQSLVFLNMPAMQQPEAYIGGFNDMFDDQGKVKEAGTRAFLGKIAAAFADWIETILRA